MEGKETSNVTNATNSQLLDSEYSVKSLADEIMEAINWEVFNARK